MKLQPTEAGTWLFTFLISGTMMAGAQSSVPISPPVRQRSVERFESAVLPAGRFSKVELLPTAPVVTDFPDAPSAVEGRQAEAQTPSSAVLATDRSPQPAGREPIGRMFWVANSILFASTIANAELITRCQPTLCNSVPDAIRTRGALYAIGIPASLGITYICYRLKRNGTRMWIAPVAAFSAGNVAYAVHAAHDSR